jgi:hypothetical protein
MIAPRFPPLGVTGTTTRVVRLDTGDAGTTFLLLDIVSFPDFSQ